MSLNGITGKPSFDKSLGTAFTASSSSPQTRLVYVSDGSTVPASFHARPENMTKGVAAIIAECLGEPEITSKVCRAWRAGTDVAYKREALATYPRDQYSLALLKLATQQVFPDLTAAYTPEEYRKLDYATCQIIYRNIKIIQDKSFLNFFDRLLGEIPPGSRPIPLLTDRRPLAMPKDFPTDIHERANALRKWMAIEKNQVILSLIKDLDLLYAGVKILPTEVGQFTGLKLLKIEGNGLAALPDSIGQLAALHCLILSDNNLAALPDSIGQLAALRYLFLHGNPLLAVLPESMDRLNLEQLVLRSNQLVTKRTPPERLKKLNARIIW